MKVKTKKWKWTVKREGSGFFKKAIEKWKQSKKGKVKAKETNVKQGGGAEGGKEESVDSLTNIFSFLLQIFDESEAF